MEHGSVIAFRSSAEDERRLEVRANFGVFTGREATSAELDELGQLLLREVGQVAVISEQRHEVGVNAGAALHQVRIEIDEEQVPAAREERDELAERLVALAQDWILLCAAERHAEVTE